MELSSMAFVFLLLAGCTLQAQARSPPLSKGEMIYYSLLDLRENTIKNPSFQKIPMAAEIIRDHAFTLKYMVGVDVDDDEAIKEIAFAIADAKNLDELSEAIGVPASMLKDIEINQMMIAMGKAYLEMGIGEVEALHSWIKASGFPDKWPLSVSESETVNMFEKCPLMGKLAVAYTYAELYSNEKLAKIITDDKLKSVNEYFAAIDYEELNAEDAEEHLVKLRESILQLSRVLGSTEGKNDFIGAFRSGINVLETAVDSGLLKLFEK